MDRDAVLSEIQTALERINELREPDAQILIGPDTVLFGAAGSLDSLGLVTLLIDLEESVSSRAGVPLVLTDEKAMSQRHNPFRTVSSLADYIIERLNSETQ